MKIKVAEATGKVLDWMVAVAEGRVTDGVRILENTPDYFGERHEISFNPSTNWTYGGPIIEREKLGTLWDEDEGYWSAYHGCGPLTLTAGKAWAIGPTALVAAMRCFVASKLGDEVDVPKELI